MEQKTMSKCGAKTEVYSRVCGYHRPIKNWNKGKQEEFRERKAYEPVIQAKEKR
jgi:ribonucleoside-triphosphate reductase